MLPCDLHVRKASELGAEGLRLHRTRSVAKPVVSHKNLLARQRTCQSTGRYGMLSSGGAGTFFEGHGNFEASHRPCLDMIPHLSERCRSSPQSKKKQKLLALIRSIDIGSTKTCIAVSSFEIVFKGVACRNMYPRSQKILHERLNEDSSNLVVRIFLIACCLIGVLYEFFCLGCGIS